jgi:polar amino acid transport system substrate-binding protein
VLNYAEKEIGASSEQRIVQLKPSTIVNDRSVIAGFIGAGNFTKSVLFPNLKKISDLSLKGLCTASGMSGSETGKKEGFEFATTERAQILSNKEINTVFITTRHDTHADLVIESLKAGKHVFVEKPLAMSPAELSAIQEACESNSRILMVGFNRRFSPHTSLIRKFFEKRSTPMAITYRINAGMIPKGTWIQDGEAGGGRIIGEVCHFVDFCSSVIGCSPSQVQATCIETDNTSIVGEDSLTIALKYPDGSIASIFYVALGSADLPKERCEFFSDGSVAVMENFEKSTCMGKLGKKSLKGKQEKGFSEELTTFVDSIKNGSTHPIPLSSLFSTTAATFAILESLKTGLKQSIPSFDL